MTIKSLNDEFRAGILTGDIGHNKVVLTRGVQVYDINEVLLLVANYTEFTNDNDPYQEHDMGDFKIDAKSIFWKIDYYDLTMTYLSEDPSDPTKTIRVLTIMLAEEL